MSRLIVLSCCLSLAACGANVVFGEGASDQGGNDSTGGAGAGTTSAQGGNGPGPVTNSSTSTSSNSSTSSGVMTSCQNDDCEIGQVVCQCNGECALCNDVECFLWMTQTKCEWQENGAVCECSVNGKPVGECDQLDLNCDTTEGCCAPLFASAMP